MSRRIKEAQRKIERRQREIYRHLGHSRYRISSTYVLKTCDNNHSAECTIPEEVRNRTCRKTGYCPKMADAEGCGV